MALFRFTLDGNILADEPEGWDKIISELRRDKEVSGQLLLMDLTLFFHGGTDGYNILKPLIDCQGFCAFSTLKIEQSCNNDNDFTEIYNGIIFYTLVKEYLTPCTLECKLKDNSYAAKIDNNKNIEAFINVGRSKNDEAISAAQQYIVKFFNPNDILGNYTSPVKVFPVWACFEFIIDYMTDGEMGFVSDYFRGNLLGETDGQFMTITTGEQIRVGHGGNSTNFPFISFQKLFDEVNKKINIGFSIKDVGGVKKMRIEPKSYFFNETSSVTLNNVKGIVKSVNTAELYSKLVIGSSQTLPYELDPASGCAACFPTDITFVGFKEETFTLTGKCNIDTELNLVSDWIIDSNIIQKIFVGGETDYDDDIIFVMADYISATPVAIKYDVFGNGPPYFYNGFLRNSEVVVRWLGAVPNSIALYLGNGNDDFRAEGTTYIPSSGTTSIPHPDVFLIEPTSFQDDFNAPNFDTNGNYDNAGWFYTAPSSGLFTFDTFLPFEINKLQQVPLSVRLRGYFRVYDSFGIGVNPVLQSLLFQDTGTLVLPAVTTNVNLQGSFLVYMNAGEKIYVGYQIGRIAAQQSGSYRVLPTRTFACTSSETGGGIYQTYNPEDFKAYLYDFDYPLTFADFQTIIANPLKLIDFNDGTNFISAWIDNMKYDHQKGKAKFTLINSVPKTECE